MALAVKAREPHPQGAVPRPRLLQALEHPVAARVVLLSAPTGYGKTALLSEWAARAPERTAWLALEPCHEDPRALVCALSECLGAVDPLCVGAPGSAASARALAELATPTALVVDDLHVLSCPESLRVLTGVAEHLPPHSRLALASRTRPPLPLGRLRAHRALVELGPGDLALTAAEAGLLLQGAGVALGEEQIRTLTERTEGWPAALYLAALALRDSADRALALERFCGADEIVAEYVREEFLEALTGEERELVVRGSVCELLSPRLCDALRERGGSARILEALARGPLPFEAVDTLHERYRAHPLVRDVLRSELRRSGLRSERRAHARARAWHALAGEIDAAIAHAIAGDDLEAAGALIWEHLSAYVAAGHNEDLQVHLRALSDEQIASRATLAASAAHSALSQGRLRSAERYARAAAAALAHDPAPAALSSLHSGIAAIELALARDGMATMAHAIERARRGEDEHGPWQSTFSLLRGVCAHLAGERAGARRQLEAAVHDAAVSAPSIEMLCLSQLSLLSAEEGDLEAALVEIDAARSQVDRHALRDYPIAALHFAVSAELHSRAGAPERAKPDAEQADRLLERLGEFIAWYGAECRIALARAELRLGEPADARGLLAHASRLARRVSDAPLLASWLQQAWAELDAMAASAMADSTALTMAELRVLRFLPTHLSFREIAERLHVSANTVKTQAHAVYRKLGVRSRSQAVERAGRIGLLEG